MDKHSRALIRLILTIATVLGLPAAFAQVKVILSGSFSAALAVHTGSPKPDIRSVDAFRQTLLSAKSITVISTPGIYMTTELFSRLGIAKEILGKITDTGVAAVASGQSEIVIQPVSDTSPASISSARFRPKLNSFPCSAARWWRARRSLKRPNG